MTSSLTNAQINNLYLLSANENGLNSLPIRNTIAPAGTIALWGLGAIPKGWVLCDGSNGTPNMTRRFPLGWGLINHGAYPPGTTGGSEYSQLTIENIPSHKHSVTRVTVPNNNMCKNGIITESIGNISFNVTLDVNNVKVMGATQYNPNLVRTLGMMTPSSNNYDNYHNNMPPYTVLKFIMKL